MYSAVMAVLSNAINNWTEFDGWCLSRGFNPLEVPCRRLVAAAWAFLTDNMDPEVKEKLIQDLMWEEVKETKVYVSDTEDYPTNKVAVPKERWRAPEGWTPPGWDEEKSYKNAMDFVAFQSNPK